MSKVKSTTEIREKFFFNDRILVRIDSEHVDVPESEDLVRIVHNVWFNGADLAKVSTSEEKSYESILEFLMFNELAREHMESIHEIDPDIQTYKVEAENGKDSRVWVSAGLAYIFGHKLSTNLGIWIGNVNSALEKELYGNVYPEEPYLATVEAMQIEHKGTYSYEKLVMYCVENDLRIEAFEIKDRVILAFPTEAWEGVYDLEVTEETCCTIDEHIRYVHKR